MAFKKDIFGLEYVNYNRSYQSTQALQNEKQKPSSFILGNSRSIAITCTDWKQYLQSSEIPFHFDGSKENIFQIRKKLEFLVKNGYPVKNIIAVVDFETLNNFSDSGHIYQLHHEVSGDKLSFHLNEIKPFFNLKYILSLGYYSLTKKYNKFMRGYIVKDKLFSKGSYNDLFFLNELEIKRDSVQYYERSDAKKMFKVKHYSKLQQPEKLNKELTIIRNLVDQNEINFKFLIVSPYYLNELGLDYRNLVNRIFNHNEVYDFSSLEYKYHKGNYHEASHFRRHVGKYFLKKMYE